MPRPRFQKLASDRQEAILHAAAEEFAAHGYDGASYNHIIEAAGISKGAAYYYFDDKEDLYLTVVRHLVEDFARDVSLPASDAVRTPVQFWRMIERYTEQVIRYTMARPVLMGVMRSANSTASEGLRTAAAAESAAFGRGFMEHVLRLGQSVGAVRTDVPFELLLSLLMAIDEVADGHMTRQGGPVDEGALAAHGALVVDLVRRLLVPAGPEKKRRAAR